MYVQRVAPDLAEQVKGGTLALDRAERTARDREKRESFKEFHATGEFSGLYDVVVVDSPWAIEKI